MSDSQALAIRQPITPSIWQTIEAIAPTMHQSRFFGVSSPAQAAAVMLKGHELGLGIATSFEFITVIKDKPVLIPRGALALIVQSPECAGVKISEKPGACTVWMKRRNGFEYQVTWTIEDADRAGLITREGSTKADGTVRDKGNWEKYPANMLRWRAIGFCADVVFPDVIGGMKRADEFGAEVDHDGNVVQPEWSVTSVATTPDPVPEPAKPVPWTLDALVEKYGAELVLQALEGRVPGNDADVAKAAEVLEAGNAK